MKEVLYVIELCESGSYEESKFLGYTKDIDHAKHLQDKYEDDNIFYVNIIEVGFLGDVK